MLRSKKASASHQSPRYEYYRISGYYWIASVSGIRRPCKTSGGPQIGSEASISSYSELHSLDKTG